MNEKSATLLRFLARKRNLKIYLTSPSATLPTSVFHFITFIFSCLLRVSLQYSHVSRRFQNNILYVFLVSHIPDTVLAYHNFCDLAAIQWCDPMRA
jgi:hypothetical protein